MRLVWRDVELVAGKPAIFTSLTHPETVELQRLAKGRRVLEVGTAFGYSTIAMGLAGTEDIAAVDPHQTHGSLQAFCQNLETFGLVGAVKVCVGTSQTVLPDLPRGYFGLVFIDGDHTSAGVSHDLLWARQLVKPFGGVIACHDYGEDTCPEVKPSLDAWKRPDYVIDTLAVYSDPRWP